MNLLRKSQIEGEYFPAKSVKNWRDDHSTYEIFVSVSSDEPEVAILLCIYEGKHYLSEQLESIAQQTHKNWRLYISDDGDCPESRAILEAFKNRFENEKVRIFNGPKKGFVRNFLSLTCDKSINADYFAFSDQDDIWHKNKIQNALRLLSKTGKETPSLYCSRTIIVNKDNEEIGLSPLFNKPPSFVNALVQNIGGGNTMVFNRKTRELALQAGKDIPVITHDWWIYLLVTGCDGEVIYDPAPSLRYRQHPSNIVGCNITWSARLYRIYMLLRGKFKNYNDRNMRALLSSYHLLSDENKKLLDQFYELRNTNLFKRIAIFYRLKIYRQTVLGNLGLWVAVCLNKI